MAAVGRFFKNVGKGIWNGILKPIGKGVVSIFKKPKPQIESQQQRPVIPNEQKAIQKTGQMDQGYQQQPQMGGYGYNDYGYGGGGYDEMPQQMGRGYQPQQPASGGSDYNDYGYPMPRRRLY